MELQELQSYTRNLHVLFVEDSSTQRRVIGNMLEGLFASLEVAVDGAQAWEMYREYYDENECHYDLVITDLEMPNLDGEGLSENILAMNPAQEIIVISSSNDFSRLVDLINKGVKKFVAKPVKKEQLDALLHQVAQQIRLNHLRAEEQAELAEYNEVLKQREEAHLRTLERTNKDLQEFMDALTQSSIVSKTDPNGIITYVNDDFCNISGYSPEELIGHSHNIVNSGKMGKSFYTRLWNTITSGKPYVSRFINRAKDGSIYYINSYIKPIFDIDGNIREFIAVSTDMTRLMESLQNEQNARKAKDEFFINISHEMRTPLNAIMGFSGLLKKRLKDDQKSSDMVEIIDEASKELNTLIESMLDVRKLKENRLQLVETEFSPVKELQHCFEKYKQKAEKKKQQSFVAVIDDEMPGQLFGDYKRMVQSISAIIDNAIKFTPEGGFVEINAFYIDEDEKLICQIKDSGVGIAKEDQEKIFFQGQADGSLSRAHEGAGLGLSIATKIIELMGGSLSVSSEVGQGSTFMAEFKLKKLDKTSQ